MNWAERVKLLRAKSFLKQEALAELLGVKQSSISRWENGLSIPGREVQKALLDLLAQSQLDPPGDKALSFQVRHSESMVLIDTSMVFQGASSILCRAYQRSVSDVVGRRNDDRMMDEGENLRRLIHEHMPAGAVVFAKNLNGGYDAAGNILYTLSDIAPIKTSAGDTMLAVTAKLISREMFEEQKDVLGGFLKVWTVDDAE